MAFCLREKRTVGFPKGLPVASHFLNIWPLMVVSYKYELLFKVSWQEAICQL